MTVLRMFEAEGVVACFDEPNTIGDKLDIDAPRNAPAKSPHLYLNLVHFHSSFDFMEVVVGPTVVPINHAAVAAASAPAGATIAFGWNAATGNHLLVSHGLGYVPHAMVVHEGNLLWPGMPVQVQGDGGVRYASVYVTASEVRLFEYASVGPSTLEASTQNYTVLVFRQPFPPAPGAKLFEYNSGTGEVKLARDRIRSSRRYLQVAPGGSPFGIALGRTIDLNNGAVRAFRPNGTYSEPVPSIQVGLSRPQGFSTVYGAPMVYGGSYAGSTSIQVQAP